jgi:4'-phosphopantetheinyl transferase
MLRVAVARVARSPDDGGDAMPGWLGESERRRWTTLSSPARGAFVTSRALLRELLQAATGVPAPAWAVSAETGRAPVATSSEWALAIHVSLSHRLGWAAAAVGESVLGVDVECDRPARGDPAERAALMLSPDEFAQWQALAADDREAALLARWTAKEAWFKALPPEAAPWDFRRVRASARAPADARANVRTWRATPVHLALCCGDARALAEARCDGLPPVAVEAFWHVAAAA